MPFEELRECAWVTLFWAGHPCSIQSLICECGQYVRPPTFLGSGISPALIQRWSVRIEMSNMLATSLSVSMVSSGDFACCGGSCVDGVAIIGRVLTLRRFLPPYM